MRIVFCARQLFNDMISLRQQQQKSNIFVTNAQVFIEITEINANRELSISTQHYLIIIPHVTWLTMSISS